MISLGYKTTQIANILGVSRPTVYRMMHDANINLADRYTNISASELDQKVSNIKSDHPNIGEVMAEGHLRAEGIKVRRSALRTSLLRVDLQVLLKDDELNFATENMIIQTQIMYGT